MATTAAAASDVGLAVHEHVCDCGSDVSHTLLLIFLWLVIIGFFGRWYRSNIVRNRRAQATKEAMEMWNKTNTTQNEFCPKFDGLWCCGNGPTGEFTEEEIAMAPSAPKVINYAPQGVHPQGFPPPGVNPYHGLPQAAQQQAPAPAVQQAPAPAAQQPVAPTAQPEGPTQFPSLRFA